MLWPICLPVYPMQVKVIGQRKFKWSWFQIMMKLHKKETGHQYNRNLEKVMILCLPVWWSIYLSDSSRSFGQDCYSLSWCHIMMKLHSNHHQPNHLFEKSRCSVTLCSSVCLFVHSTIQSVKVKRFYQCTLTLKGSIIC